MRERMNKCLDFSLLYTFCLIQVNSFLNHHLENMFFWLFQAFQANLNYLVQVQVPKMEVRTAVCWHSISISGTQGTGWSNYGKGAGFVFSGRIYVKNLHKASKGQPEHLSTWNVCGAPEEKVTETLSAWLKIWSTREAAKVRFCHYQGVEKTS